MIKVYTIKIERILDDGKVTQGDMDLFDLIANTVGMINTDYLVSCRTVEEEDKVLENLLEKCNDKAKPVISEGLL